MKTLFASIAPACLKPAAVAALVVLSSAAAQAAIISVNVRDGGATPNNSYVTTSFGIAAENSVVGFWTNTNSFSVGAPTNNLLDSTGANSGVSLTMLNPGGTQYWGAGYAGTPWNFGPSMFTATANPVSLTFNNLSAYFPNGFYALVYVNGTAANTGAAVSDGTTSYFFRPAATASTTPLLITDTVNPGAGNFVVGNYAKFGSELDPYLTNSITFTIPPGLITAGNVGIGGVQLIGVIPEPSTYAAIAGLMAFGLVGLHRLRRRRSA
jgi:hypothetical protein